MKIKIEKLLNDYEAGPVPLYYGDKSVLQDMNKEAFIFQGDFKLQQEMIEKIKEVDLDDKLYCEI